MILDVAQPLGYVTIVKRNANSGLVTFEKTFKNTLTNYSRQQAAQLWAGAFVKVPSMIAVGTGSPPQGQTGTTPNDTALWNELSGTRLSLDYATTFLQYYTQYSLTYLQTQAIGTVTSGNPDASIDLTECGLFDADGNLWSHVALTGVTHDNTSTLSIQWQVLHNGN